MATRKLTVWASDGASLRQLNLGSLEIGEIRSHGWDWKIFHTDLLRSLEKGLAPDVIEVGTTWTNRLAREGSLLNITQFATEYLHAASIFFPHPLYSCLDAVQIDQYYALPLLADVRILFYNKDYLNTYLTDHPNAFKNWTAFEEMCKTLKEQFPGRVIAWPLGSDAFHDSLPWVWAAGGDFISLSRQVLIDSERTQEALCRLARLILTDCAPLPPDRLIDSLIELRTQFMVGGFGIVAGSLWITQTPDWQSRFKTTLHPPDLFPATFIGGSNLAIVRKYGDNENAETYQLAKKFLELAVNAENQIRLARVIGKLPCNIAAWEQMKQEEKDENGKAALDMFDKALCHTVDRGMPNLLNFAQIEEELKNSVATIWANVGEIKRASPEASLETLETECRVMIHRELTKARQQIEKFLTGYTVQYTRQEVEEIGIIPPGQFDLWLEVTSNTPTVKGKVYVTARGEIQTGIGPKLFGVLYALTNAPQRTLSQEKLLEDFWEYKPALHSKCIEIISLKRQLSLLARLIRKSWQLNQNQLLNELQQHSNELPYSTLISKMEKRRKWGPHFSIDYFRDLACEIIASLCEEIETIADKLDPKPKIEDLRKTYENLNKYLGEIKGRPVINRLRPDHYDLYLDSNLSICLVVL